MRRKAVDVPQLSSNVTPNTIAAFAKTDNGGGKSVLLCAPKHQSPVGNDPIIGPGCGHMSLKIGIEIGFVAACLPFLFTLLRRGLAHEAWMKHTPSDNVHHSYMKQQCNC
jgi:hypothetical protein